MFHYDLILPDFFTQSDGRVDEVTHFVTVYSGSIQVYSNQ